MTRATRAEIDLAALQHNFKVAARFAGGAKLMAIIKANAYGHGMLPVAKALHGADAFGVATLDEAIALRNAAIDKPITLLEGITRAEQLTLVAQHRLDMVVHHPLQVEWLTQYRGTPIGVWLKVDTGMHRLGFLPEHVAPYYTQLRAAAGVQQPIRWFTHLANADDRHDNYTQTQLDRFQNVLSDLADADAIASIANSAGLLGWPSSRAHWLRPGIMLYGVSPFNDDTAAQHDLLPVMRLSSELIAVNHYRRGEPIGYGGSYRCPEDMPIGVVAIGYGDGYPRHAKPGTPVLVNGKRVPLVGRVSMDMITVDLRTQPQARIGDPVTLWGDGLPIEDIARHADTIGYALLCGVTARVPYQYRD